MFGSCYFGEPYFGAYCGVVVIIPSVRETLGCGSYDAYVLTRGGAELVATFEWTELTWQRVLDDTSAASANAGSFPDCDTDVFWPWRYELAIYRNGSLIWVGPIIEPKSPPDQYALQARDLTAWWDHRLIHEDHLYPNPTDLAIIFQDISDDAMDPDPSPGLSVSPSPCGVTAMMELLAVQHFIAADKIRDLTTTGIDWTVIARDVLAGGAVVPTGSIGTFLDEHFVVPPTPRIDGTSQANSWLVRGSGGGAAGDTIYGSSTDPTAAALDGLLESVATVSTLQDNDSALAAAQSRTAITTNVTLVENCILAAEAPFTIDQLVPGALCDLALTQTKIPVFGHYRLAQVDGAAQSGDGSASETITLTFQPAGTT